MKNLPPALLADLQEQATSYVYCWRITRTDGIVEGYTSTNADLEFLGTTFRADTGFIPSAAQFDLGLEVDNMDFTGGFALDGVRKEDVIAGRYDNAFVEIFWVNHENPELRLLVSTGFFGSASWKGDEFVISFKSLIQLLEKNLGRQYWENCDAQLYDSRCKASRATHTLTGRVAGEHNNRNFHFEVLEDANSRNDAPGYFSLGLCRFLSGPLSGLSYQVRESFPNVIHLYAGTPLPFDDGDEFILEAGCRKDMATCRQKFNNIQNFQGFPWMPSSETLSRTAEQCPTDEEPEPAPSTGGGSAVNRGGGGEGPSPGGIHRGPGEREILDGSGHSDGGFDSSRDAGLDPGRGFDPGSGLRGGN